MAGIKKEPTKEILPESGFWTMENLAAYLEVRPDELQDKFSEFGIKTMRFGIKYKHRLICLSELRAKFSTPKGAA